MLFSTTGAPEVPRADADYWSQHYRRYLALRPDSVVAALRVIADAPGATIVHCAAGKDRTGTVIGLALAVAGVNRRPLPVDPGRATAFGPGAARRINGDPAAGRRR